MHTVRTFCVLLWFVDLAISLILFRIVSLPLKYARTFGYTHHVNELIQYHSNVQSNAFDVATLFLIGYDYSVDMEYPKMYV